MPADQQLQAKMRRETFCHDMLSAVSSAEQSMRNAAGTLWPETVIRRMVQIGQPLLPGQETELRARYAPYDGLMATIDGIARDLGTLGNQVQTIKMRETAAIPYGEWERKLLALRTATTEVIKDVAQRLPAANAKGDPQELSALFQTHAMLLTDASSALARISAAVAHTIKLGKEQALS